MKRSAVSWALAVLVSCAFLPASPTMGGGFSDGKPGVGDLAPLFSVQDIHGKSASLEEIMRSGKVIFLNFWGLRCGNCITEIGYLNQLSERYAPMGVEFLGINVDGIPADRLGKLMPKMPNVPKYRVIPDPDMTVPDLYNMAAVPLSIIIGKNRKIKYRHEDFREGDEEEMERELEKVIGEGN